jgi:hypothetical protein
LLRVAKRWWRIFGTPLGAVLTAGLIVPLAVSGPSVAQEAVRSPLGPAQTSFSSHSDIQSYNNPPAALTPDQSVAGRASRIAEKSVSAMSGVSLTQDHHKEAARFYF